MEADASPFAGPLEHSLNWERREVAFGPNFHKKIIIVLFSEKKLLLFRDETSGNMSKMR